MLAQGVLAQGVLPQGVLPQGVLAQGVLPQGVLAQGALAQGCWHAGLQVMQEIAVSTATILSVDCRRREFQVNRNMIQVQLLDEGKDECNTLCMLRQLC